MVALSSQDQMRTSPSTLAVYDCFSNIHISISASWEKHRAVTANLTSSDVQNAAPTDPDLTCPLCKRLLRDAVKTPCCSTSYCEECIHNYLSENDFVCPECESKIKSLKILVKDEDRRARAKQYMEDTLKASKALGEAEKKAKQDSENKGDGENRTGFQEPDSLSKIEGDPTEEGEVHGDEQVGSNLFPSILSRG